MTKKFFFLAAMFASHSMAATVSLSPTVTVAGFHGSVGTVIPVKSSLTGTTAGAALPAGSQIRIGFFTNYSTELDATLKTSSGLASLLGSNSANVFVPLGELGNVVSPGLGDNTIANNDIKTVGSVLRASVNMTNISFAGAADGSDANKSGLGGLGRGTKLFVLIYNNDQLVQDFNAAGFEYGLYSASTWTAPLIGTGTLTLKLEDVDTAGEVYWGGLGSLHTAVSVPETSVSMMFLLSLGMVFRRRR